MAAVPSADLERLIRRREAAARSWRSMANDDPRAEQRSFARQRAEVEERRLQALKYAFSVTTTTIE